MKIMLHEQAQDALENNRIEDNSAGIFEQHGVFVWFTMVKGQFDCGECNSLKEAFSKLK